MKNAFLDFLSTRTGRGREAWRLMQAAAVFALIAFSIAACADYFHGEAVFTGPVEEGKPEAAQKAEGEEKNKGEGKNRKTFTAVLWMHTSAEYRALCLQTYRGALAAVTAEVKRMRFGKRGAVPAVVMDLDATVIDNSKFDMFLLANNLKFTRKINKDWLAAHPGGEALVPGALKFIRGVEAQGVEVFFITSRTSDRKETTFATLKRLGVFAEDAELDDVSMRLLLRTDTRSKEPRRKRVLESYTVVGYVGDNLADFAPEFEAPSTASFAERNGLVSMYADRWGARWFVLPNPVYGDWLTSLGEENIEGLLKEAKD